VRIQHTLATPQGPLTRFGGRFGERAIAAFQALVEFAVMAPVRLTDTAQRLALFEQFWDSDAPRFGEPVRDRNAVPYTG
jgi:hypothetical protein